MLVDEPSARIETIHASDRNDLASVYVSLEENQNNVRSNLPDQHQREETVSQVRENSIRFRVTIGDQNHEVTVPYSVVSL